MTRFKFPFSPEGREKNVNPMQKPIGIFGGTFDPIHLGHTHVAKEILKQLPLREIRFIPCYQPVHRPPPIASPQDRLAMVKLAIADHTDFVADDREIRRQGPSYMIDTLISLRKEFAATPLCLILATDAFAEFHRWHRWQEIPQYAHLLVIKRQEYPLQDNSILTPWIKQKQIQDVNLLQQQLAGNILFIDVHSLPISATEIRQQIAAGKEPRNLLSKGVLEYIKIHGLYQTN